MAKFLELFHEGEVADLDAPEATRTSITHKARTEPALDIPLLIARGTSTIRTCSSADIGAAIRKKFADTGNIVTRPSGSVTVRNGLGSRTVTNLFGRSLALADIGAAIRKSR